MKNLQKQENGLHSISTYQVRKAIDTLQVNYDLFDGRYCAWILWFQLTKSISSKVHCRNSTTEKRFCDNLIIVFDDDDDGLHLISISISSNGKCLSLVSIFFPFSTILTHKYSLHMYAHRTHTQPHIRIQNRIFRFASARLYRRLAIS